MDTLKQLQKKSLHTAKLVPQSQRDLFISEIETIITLAFEAGKAEAIAMVLKEIEEIKKQELLFRDSYFYTSDKAFMLALDTLKTKLTAKE